MFVAAKIDEALRALEICINPMPATTRPVRSTRNKYVNYAESDTECVTDAEYDSDYTPPTAADFRTTTTTARRSARVNETRKSTDSTSSSSSHGYNTRRRGGQ